MLFIENAKHEHPGIPNFKKDPKKGLAKCISHMKFDWLVSIKKPIKFQES